MIWFTADTHFGHKAILEHCERDFSCTEDMDEFILNCINARVKRNDILYHLGDFCWKASMAGHYRQRINCRTIHVVRGNHDAASLRKVVSSLEHMVFLKKHKIHLCHYPLVSWQWRQYGGVHLHGHSHGRAPTVTNQLDVGFDVFNYPVSLDEINAAKIS